MVFVGSQSSHARTSRQLDPETVDECVSSVLLLIVAVRSVFFSRLFETSPVSHSRITLDCSACTPAQLLGGGGV